jgi:hypothetical protein
MKKLVLLKKLGVGLQDTIKILKRKVTKMGWYELMSTDKALIRKASEEYWAMKKREEDVKNECVEKGREY